MKYRHDVIVRRPNGVRNWGESEFIKWCDGHEYVFRFIPDIGPGGGEFVVSFTEEAVADQFRSNFLVDKTL